MKEKLQLLMTQLQLKPGQFARILEINPAIISHILAERNKPGVDLLQKILDKFPQVSPDWLMLDRGDMFRSRGETFSENRSGVTVADDPLTERSLFPSTEHPTPTITNAQPDARPETEPTNPALHINTPKTASANKRPSRVVLFYADGTFESFTPNEQ
ncbi:MAG: helix-turn-helix domain-containing protein [Alistipes senegalensis]|nr:helix-turn-helix domain-containing protein [Bacteroides cellulosilyticus]MCM1351459.1 helix-turn-helix domain-containing protein [Alistipes senegalensis]